MLKEIEFPNKYCIEPSDAGSNLSKEDWMALGVHIDYRVARVAVKEYGTGFDTAEQALVAAEEAAKKYERDHFPGGMAHAKRNVY